MTYSAIELSEDSGLPVRLYEIRRGQIVYRYTSADRDIDWGGETWVSKPGGMIDGGINASGPSEQDELTITCSQDVEVVQWFRGTPPSDRVSLTVRRVHTTDVDLEATVVWVGLVTAMRQPSDGKANLFCQSVLYSLQQQGLRLSWSRACPHFLYDDNCRVSKATFAVAAVVDSVSGVTVSASELSAKANGWFDGGFIEWDLDLLGTVERRPIESHVGTNLTLLTLTDGLMVGTDIRVYPGCARNVTTCKDKFNNLPNYGGVPHLPGVNPFDIGVLNGVTSTANTRQGGFGITQATDGSGRAGGTATDGGGVPQDGSTTDSPYSGGEGAGV